MFEKFVERAVDHLAEFRKELASVEKLASTLNDSQPEDFFAEDEGLLSMLEPPQQSNLLTKLRRLCENLGRLSGNQTIPALHFSKNGVDSTASLAADGNVTTCFREQANFWTIFRSTVDTTLSLEHNDGQVVGTQTQDTLQSVENPKIEEIRLQKMIKQFQQIYVDKVKVWNKEIESSFSNLRRQNASFFEEVFTSSIEIIHYIISEDAHLSYVHKCLRGFQNVEDQEIMIRRKEEELQNQVKAKSSDLQTLINRETDLAICEEFVDLIILKLKTSNTSLNAVTYLQRFGFNDLASIINGLTPYYDNNLLAKLWSKDAMYYKGLDVFGHQTKQSATTAGGNDNWLDMIRQLQLYSADKANPRYLRKLTSYLSFDHAKYDEFLVQPLDKLHNILRVASD